MNMRKPIRFIYDMAVIFLVTLIMTLIVPVFIALVFALCVHQRVVGVYGHRRDVVS